YDLTNEKLFGVYLGATSNNGQSAYALFRDIQLEEGNRATAWSPNPDDLTDRISEAETSIDQNAEQISLRAKKSEVDDVNDDVLDLDAELKGQADEISSKVSQKDFDKTTNSITDDVSRETQRANELSQTVNSISVGGRNILRYTDCSIEENIADWYSWLGYVSSVSQREVEGDYYLRIGVSSDVEEGYNPRIRTPYRYHLQNGQT